MKKQYSIPDEIMAATLRALQNYRQRLERDIKVLTRANATPARMEAHRKLTLLVGRLESFYSNAEDALTESQVSWDDHEGNRQDLRLYTRQDALLEAADRHEVYDHVEIELI